MSYRTVTLLFLIVTGTAVVAKAAQASEPIRCDCLFAQSSGYRAVGTRAVCSAVTHKNMKGPGESCEIGFGGTSYQEPLVSRLESDPKKYRDSAFEVTEKNLKAVLLGSPQTVADAGFLQQAIPMYMRAAYLRQDTGIDFSVLVALDKEVHDVSNEFAKRIAEVFQGRQNPFEMTWRERHRLAVDRGGVKFVYDGQITIVAVFFDAEMQR